MSEGQAETQERITPEAVVSDHLEMYRLPGDPPLERKDIDRYIKSNNRLKNSLPSLISRGVHDLNPEVRLAAFRSSSSLSEHERKPFIERGLADTYTSVRRFAVGAISSAPEDDQAQFRATLAPLIERDLADPNRYVRLAAVSFISSAPKNQRKRLIEQALGDNDSLVRGFAAESISSVPEDDQAQLRAALVPLIERDLPDSEFDVRQAAARLISSAPKGERKRLIEQALDDTDIIVRRPVIESISSAPEEERAVLIEKGLVDADFILRSHAAGLIPSVPENERTKLIKKGLADTEPYVSIEAARAISSAPEDDQAELRASLTPMIEEGLAHPDRYHGTFAARIIPEAPEEERAAFIEKGLANSDSAIRIESAQAISSVPEDQRKRLIEQALVDTDPEVRRVVSEFIEPTSEDEISQNMDSDPDFFDQLKNLAATTPLYSEPGDKRFFQYGFSKTGSGLTLLDRVPGSDKSLRDRLVRRTIPLDAYLAWEKAYEAPELWREMGFDYVPIEPIVSVHESKKNMQADVYTRVLQGPSVHKWLTESGGLHRQHIIGAIEKIKVGLGKLGVEHGHLHENNFVLVFDRDQEGNPEIKNPPHVYAIDFDAAESGSDS